MNGIKSYAYCIIYCLVKNNNNFKQAGLKNMHKDRDPFCMLKLNKSINKYHYKIFTSILALF